MRIISNELSEIKREIRELVNSEGNNKIYTMELELGYIEAKNRNEVLLKALKIIEQIEKLNLPFDKIELINTY